MKCDFCNRKADLNKKWSFCVDCCFVICAGCTNRKTCNRCGKDYFNTYEENMQRMIASSQKPVWTDKKPVLYFFFAVYNLNGFGCDVNHEKAFEYFKKSADKNFPPAITCLANMYGEGMHVEKDFKKSFSYYLKAAFMGYGEALFCLAIFFLKGCVVEKNTKNAIFYLEQAAKKEYAQSYMVLSRLCRTELDFTKADFYYKKHIGEDEPKLFLIQE